MTAMCSSVALFLTMLDGGGALGKFAYSFAIGLSCWFVIDGGRLATVWGVDRVRALRRLPVPADPAVHFSWAGMLPLIALGAVLGPAIGTALVDRLFGHQSPSMLQLDSMSTRITLAISLLCAVVATVILTSVEHLAKARASAEAAQREAAEMQLQLLQSQLEPHMLFNTLANLRVLIGTDAGRAQAMLDRLIAYLRATLAASRSPTHALAAEFARVEDYLALMSVRMGSRLQAQLDLPEPLRQVQVPALLLQPLVENAIKHGLEPQVSGGRIDVRARRDGDRLVMSVRDTGVGLPEHADSTGTRFGLVQVRQRLATLHGDRAGLTLEPACDAEGGCVATAWLPWPATPQDEAKESQP